MRLVTVSNLVTAAKQWCNQEGASFITDAEWKSYFSRKYGEMYGLFAISRYFEKKQTINPSALAAATGTIVCVAVASLVDGETVTISDGFRSLTFEFDVTGNGVTSPNKTVDVSGDTTADDVGTTLAAAINAATHLDVVTDFNVTAVNASGTLTLTNGANGDGGNVTITDTVADGSFTVTGMSGGGGLYRLPADHLSTVRFDYMQSTTSEERYPLVELMQQESQLFTRSGGSRAYAYEILGQDIKLHPAGSTSETYWHTYLPQPVDFRSADDTFEVDCVTPDGEEFLVTSVAVIGLSKMDDQSALVTAKEERQFARNRVIEWATMRHLHNMRRPMVAGGDVDTPRYPGDYIR